MLYNSLKNKKILTFLLFAFLFLGIFPFVFAVEVPLPGWDPEAVERKELLPEYIRYLFNFSLGIVGLIAFGVLVYAGFNYLTSTGEPAKMSDARDQILSALLGIVILFASYLILATIDPYLVVLQRPELKPPPVVEPPPPPKFDFDFTINPTQAIIHPDPCHALDFGCWMFREDRNHASVDLKARLTKGTPEKVTFVVKNNPDKVDIIFWLGAECTPSCDRRFRLVSNGAAPGTYPITIEARSGEIVKPIDFRLTIKR